MTKNNSFYSRGYWENYLANCIVAIKEDKDNIIDLLIYGNCVEAKITINLSRDEFPNYRLTINKLGQKSPFEEVEEDE